MNVLRIYEKRWRVWTRIKSFIEQGIACGRVIGDVHSCFGVRNGLREGCVCVDGFPILTIYGQRPHSVT